MKHWTPIVNKAFSPQDFPAYCAGVHLRDWHPDMIVLHNTGIPSLARWRTHTMEQHMLALQHFYRDQQKWSAGPHLFIDDKQIGVFTPLDHHGVHSPSWNHRAWGVEMAGDYENEAFDPHVRANTISAIAALCRLGHIKPGSLTICLHKEDPRTTHDCPGKHVDKADILMAVAGEVERQLVGGGEHELSRTLTYGTS